MQSHIRVLESSQENISALLLGLEYLINISYVDDTEVFKVLFHCLFVIQEFSWKCLRLLRCALAGLLGLLEFLSS